MQRRMTIAGDRVTIINPDKEPMFSIKTQADLKYIPWGTVYRIDETYKSEPHILATGITILTATGTVKIRGLYLSHLAKLFALHQVESVDISQQHFVWPPEDPALASTWAEIHEILFLDKSSKERE